MPQALKLVRPDGTLFSYTASHAPLEAPARAPFTSRIAFAAAHVVVDPLRTLEPLTHPVIDWDATLAYRDHLWSLGFAVAEAMDTAQRGMGLDWPLALELIQRSTRAAAARNAIIFSGAGTDHLASNTTHTLEAVTNAYLYQCEAIEAANGRIILMASRALAATARYADDYARVYSRVLSQLKQPAILHWLGPMFDPALDGYWGTQSLPEAMQNCLAVIHAHAEKIDGIKISLLDADLEIQMRRQLPASVRMYTGDDFNYDALILGDDHPGPHAHSDALLGIFDSIAPAASLALTALENNDLAAYHHLLAPTVPLSRHIFAAPTRHYKTGVVFLAYLNGFQPHFRMVAAAESSRSIPHLCELFTLADAAGLLRNPDLATHRMRLFLEMAGIA